VSETTLLVIFLAVKYFKRSIDLLSMQFDIYNPISVRRHSSFRFCIYKVRIHFDTSTVQAAETERPGRYIQCFFGVHLSPISFDSCCTSAFYPLCGEQENEGTPTKGIFLCSNLVSFTPAAETVILRCRCSSAN
jgi:hypothetical protein